MPVIGSSTWEPTAGTPPTSGSTWEPGGFRIPTAMTAPQTPVGAPAQGNVGPYRWLSNVMNNGLFSPQQINQMALQQSSTIGQGMRGQQQQAQGRAAAGGYNMPWLLGSNKALSTGQTLPQLNALAQTRTNLGVMNKQAQQQAAGQAGDLGSVLAQIEMQATRPTETPWFATQGAFDDFMGQLNQALSAATQPYPDIPQIPANSFNQDFSSFLPTLGSSGFGWQRY